MLPSVTQTNLFPKGADMSLLPSVTQTISPFVDFSKIPPAMLEHAAIRGTRVHNICFAHTKGLWAPIEPDIIGYVDSFRRWFDHVVREVYFIEERLVDDVFGFHGEPDMLVLSKHWEVMLVDVKTPLAKSKSWRLQMAGYKRLVEISSYPNPQKVGSLRLSPDGKTPHMDFYDDSAQDLNLFLQALQLHKFFNS
jgi:hypothetical protein